MKKYKIGVIGCGRIATVYQSVFREMGDRLEVLFAVDKVPEKAISFASHFPGCRYSDRIEDLLKEPLDVVHILTPHFLHKEQTIACLRAGFHVLTEKPIATTMEDAQSMIDTANETGKALGVIFQNRYIKGIQETKRLIEEGRFGKLKGAFSTLNWWRPPSYYECDWKGSWEKEGGGVLIDQAIHSLDLVRYLMGCEPVSIKGHIDRRVLTNIEVEDVADAAIVFDNGAIYSLFACNYYICNSPICIEISGEQGSALLTGDKVSIHLKGENAYTIYPESGSNVSGESYWGIHHEMQIKDFYDCLEQGGPVPVAPEDAAKTLAMVLGIYRSSRERKEIINLMY